MAGSGRSGAARSWNAPEPATERAEVPLMSIGEVLAELRVDYPDTSISKLRFLEAEGLVEPARTPAGYRKYTRADIARLRYVLAAQRDHYLPLRVIREQLAAIDRGETPSGTPVLVAVPPPGPAAGPEPSSADEPLSRAELLARAGIDDDLLTDLETHGVVGCEPGGWYPAAAVDVAAAAGALAEFGLEARHLRAYRVAADRDVGLFAQLVAPMARGSGPDARARADEAVRELCALTQRLHAALVRIGLDQTLGHH
jgi:DNA-binding transcriptional MerR regulator